MSGDVFVDASVLVAIVVEEPDWLSWAKRLESAPRRFTSPIAIVEAVMVVSTRRNLQPLEAKTLVQKALSIAQIRLLPVGADTASAAVDALSRYGKGRHPARLNLGDCISYACTREHGLTLLYKGDDFARTDLG